MGVEVYKPQILWFNFEQNFIWNHRLQVIIGKCERKRLLISIILRLKNIALVIFCHKLIPYFNCIYLCTYLFDSFIYQMYLPSVWRVFANQIPQGKKWKREREDGGANQMGEGFYLSCICP